MGKSPAFQLYPDKALAGTLHLSSNAFKAYWLTIWWMWLHSKNRCSMPDTDAAWRTATFITSSRTLTKVRLEIMNPEFPLFTKRRKKVFSEGLRKEAKKQQERAAKARLAGQASGKARNNKDLPMNSELTRSISQVELGTNTPTPTVSVSSLTKRDPPIVPPKTGGRQG